MHRWPGTAGETCVRRSPLRHAHCTLPMERSKLSLQGKGAWCVMRNAVERLRDNSSGVVPKRTMCATLERDGRSCDRARLARRVCARTLAGAHAAAATAAGAPHLQSFRAYKRSSQQSHDHFHTWEFYTRNTFVKFLVCEDLSRAEPKVCDVSLVLPVPPPACAAPFRACAAPQDAPGRTTNRRVPRVAAAKRCATTLTCCAHSAQRHFPCSPCCQESQGALSEYSLSIRILQGLCKYRFSYSVV